MAGRKKNITAKKNTKSKKNKADQGQNLRIMLATLFLLVFVGICLLILNSFRTSYLPEYAYVEEKTIVETPVKQSINYQQIYQLIETELLTGANSQGWQKLPVQGRLLRLKMFGDYPEQLYLLDLVSQVEQLSSSAQLDLLPRKGFVRLYWEKELRLELRYRVPIEVTSSRPRIAIIMDDMGRSLSTFEELLTLDLMVTPAILPESRKATEAALYLQEAGREYMIHLPMQPNNFPRANPGPNALLLGQSESKTRQLIRQYMDKVPGAVGGNNHMGSRYSQERDSMRVVLDELQHGGHFFIDSKTISSSVGYDEARKMGVPTAKRNIFLDNKEEIAYIRKQIRKMVRMSDARGEVIAICHPYAETIEAFRLELAWLKQQQIDFVPASELVHIF